MKIIKHIKTAILTLMILTVLFPGCSVKSGNSGKRIISVSILPQKYFTQAIAGDKFEVNVLIPPGATPESYEPTAQQMKNLSESVIYFKIGHIPFEKAWMKNLSEINPEMKIYDLSEGIELISDDHHEGNENGVDPHIWASPLNAVIIAENICRALISADPSNKEFYSSRLQDFILAAGNLHSGFKNAFAPLEGSSFLIYHPALGYLARDYKLHQVAFEFEGKTPSPGYMKDIINISREKNIKAILIQKQFNTEPAETIAKEIPARVIVIDPLDENWMDQMKHIGKSVVEAAGIANKY